MTMTKNGWQERDETPKAITCPKCKAPARIPCRGHEGRTCAERYRALIRALRNTDDGRQRKFFELLEGTGDGTNDGKRRQEARDA